MVKRYTHTPQDKKDDRTTGKKFANEFINRFKDVLPGLKVYEENFRDHLGHGYETIFTVSEGALNGPNIQSSGEVMIWVTSDIWPIKNEDDPRDFQRSYTIQYQLKGKYRPKFAKRWDETEILKFYDFAYEDMNAILDEFAEFVSHKRVSFLTKRVKQNLPYHR